MAGLDPAIHILTCLSGSPGLASLAPGSPQRGRLLRPLCSVFGTALLAVLHALRIEHATQDMVAHTRKVLHAAAADHDDRVLLEVMAFAGDVADHLEAVSEAHLGDLAQRRI